MNLIFDFNQNWYILFLAFLLLWIILLTSRKKHRDRKEAKEQLTFALAGLFTLFLIEVFAVSVNLWHYLPGDWPIILWPTYFVAILFGYQLLRLIEKVFSQQ
jgi:O-antigen/teichoic acid export membrane protein